MKLTQAAYTGNSMVISLGYYAKQTISMQNLEKLATKNTGSKSVSNKYP